MTEFSAATVVAMFSLVEVTLMVMWRQMATKDHVRRRFKRHKKYHHRDD